MEYIQQLQNRMLEENIALLEGVKEFQIMGPKYKEASCNDLKLELRLHLGKDLRK